MKILKIRDVKSPQRGTPKSAGIDLFIPNDFKPINIGPGNSVLIPAGIKVSVPEGHALVVTNKSGIAAKKNIIVGACLIDEDYQGEIHIDLKNIGHNVIELNPGDKITQMICIQVNYVSIEEVESEDDLYGGVSTERGAGGFGSTGVK